MVYILLAPGFEEMEALVPADLLRRAGLEVALTTVGPALVPGGHNITVQADLTLDQITLKAGDMVVLPGGGIGVENLSACPGVETLVRRAAADELVWLAAICAAPTLLARWGLLTDKKAVCYPGLEDQLTGAIPQQGVSQVQQAKTIFAFWGIPGKEPETEIGRASGRARG